MKKHRMLCVFAPAVLAGCGMMDAYERADVAEGMTRVTVGGGGPALSLMDGGVLGLDAPKVQGGIMMYLRSRTTDFKKSIYLQNEHDSQTLTLPNGTYEAHAVGFEYPNLKGAVRCGKGSDGDGTPFVLNLEGGAREVTFTLTPQLCALNAFSYVDANLAGSETWYDDNSQVKPLQIQSCNRTRFSQVVADPVNNANCSSANAGSIKSVQLEYVIYEFKEGKFNEAPPVGVHYSDCAEANVGGVMDPAARIPVGTNFAIPMMTLRIKAYTGAGASKCDPATYKGNYTFYAGPVKIEAGLMKSYDPAGGKVEDAPAYLHGTATHTVNTLFLKDFP